MANSAKNVTAGKPKASGYIYRAPVGTTVPTDASTALDEAYVCMGYASEDGLTNEHSTEETVKAWGGDIVLTTHEDKFTFTLIEALSADVLKVVHGDDNVTGTLATSIAVSVNDNSPTPAVWVVEMLLNENTLKRIVIPKGVVSEVGEVTYKDDEVVGYEVTLIAGADDDGNTHYEYLKTAGE